MIEGAKEELEILEFHHPQEFASMKLELKAFISELESQDLDLVSNNPSAATQGHHFSLSCFCKTILLMFSSIRSCVSALQSQPA